MTKKTYQLDAKGAFINTLGHKKSLAVFSLECIIISLFTCSKMNNSFVNCSCIIMLLS